MRLYTDQETALLHYLYRKPAKLKMMALGVSAALSMLASHAWGFSLDDVSVQAEKLAGRAFETPKSNLPLSLIHI